MFSRYTARLVMLATSASVPSDRLSTGSSTGPSAGSSPRRAHCGSEFGRSLQPITMSAGFCPVWPIPSGLRRTWTTATSGRTDGVFDAENGAGAIRRWLENRT